MPLTTILLEYSSDPVSDSSPTYVTVSNGEFRFIEYWEGVSEEGAGFEPGGAVIRLINVNRKWEPLYSTNTIDTHQRFRLTLNGTVEGEWFITGIALEYPGNTEWSEVVFTCGDGSEVLALDNLPSLDPPEAESYEDVVNFDEPVAYYRLNDVAGARAKAVIRRVKRGSGKKRKTIRVRRGERTVPTEGQAAAGNVGVYVDPSRLFRFQQPGLILGDTDTCVEAHSSAWAKAPVDRDVFFDPNAFTVEVWVRFVGGVYAAGPFRTGTARSIFSLNSARLELDTTAGLTQVDLVSSPSPGDIIHMVGTWDGTNACVYLNGALEATESAGGSLLQGNASEFVYFIGSSTSSLTQKIDEVAFYEHALSAERVLAHYQAGAERGFAQQTAGERIAAIADSALWSEAGIQTAGKNVLPRMMFGQPRLEEIEETMAAEGPSTLFYFEAGAPQYRGHEWRSTSSVYNTVQATFGQAEFGELPVDDLSPEYDHETFNVAQTSREGGMLVEVEDTAASGKRGRRVLDDYTGLLLTDDAEVESLANALVAQYKDPARTVPQISVSGFDDARLSKLLSLKVGHLIRVNWSGETGARNGHTANIIKRHKTLEATEALGKNGGWLLRGIYTLSRGWDATSTEWLAGIVGRSEAGVTTNAG